MDPATQSLLLIISGIGFQLGILIAAVFAGLAARDARRISQDTKVETLAQTVKIDKVATETAVVLGHVNSEKTADAKTIEFQARENQMLRDQLAEKDRVAGLLAQAASHQVARVPAAPSPTPPDAQTLDKIETNTADTAVNTKRTDAAVDKLRKDAS